MGERRRLDLELVARGLAPSRSAARHDIAAGRVLLDGVVADKAARRVGPTDEVTLIGAEAGPRTVSRAGAKLAHALDVFALDVSGRHGLDVGASTGGFTDCLLRRGAASVVAVDVGVDQLHDRLRADPRVMVREQTDIRHLSAVDLPQRPDVAVVDVSFISLRLVLPSVVALAPDAFVVALVKPQFEAGRTAVARSRGVIKDPAVWRRTLGEVTDGAADLGLRLAGITTSPIPGGTGNVEFLAWLQAEANTLGPLETARDDNTDRMLDGIVVEAEASYT